MSVVREPGVGPTWGARAQLPGLASVIDPGDLTGTKNALIDRLHKAALTHVLRDPSGQRVLDFGCGTGRLSEWLTDRGAEVLGVDASPEMIAAARERVPSTRFAVLDSQRIPAQNGAFDVVLSVYVLQYFVMEAPLLSETIHELARVLASGGQLVAIEQVQVGGLERGGPVTAYARAFASAGVPVAATPVRLSSSRIVGRAARRPLLAALPGLDRLVGLEARLVRPDRLSDGRYADYLFAGRRA
jgi:SAM-dependent methyltransferase